ncbi:unnamed protein product [Ceratitis capitata]|uniref:(Mediterranean fruit fly) hypothetical protein n=1 Tax=Ceratitis capitata TaxID=7213 RepID=A0A811VF68_CERCA|nr:unnamed protein product [Ceratitis capitata]
MTNFATRHLVTRMHPVIPHLVRVTTADYHIPNTDIVLERGMRLFIPASIGIIQLLRNFHFKPCARTKVPLVYAKKNFLIAAEGGIHLMVEKLEKTI